MTKLFFALGLLLFSLPVFASDLKVALVLDKGGKDDKSFNAAAFAGSTKAEKEFGLNVKEVEATDDAAIEGMIRSFAQKKFDLVIAIGFSMAEAVRKVASAYPNLKFALVDAEVVQPNVRSLMFEEHQGSYVVGALAGLLTKSNQVGFLGGMDVPLIRRFEMGFEAGLKKTNPKAKLVANFVGVTPEAWNNPAKAKELALSQYSQGADIVFAAAGASNFGAFDAAEDKKKFAIGCDSNQNWVKPGFVLTSMLKRVDQAVYQVIKDSVNGKFTGGTHRFGLKDGGVDYALDQYNEKLVPADVRKKVDQIKKEIIAGKIAVPDFYKKNAKK
ncbi:MAG TPA: BMP family ABC transporter substrate-binding protein [Bdellovibrionota bacterium]|jgi:basic membrane protein A